MELWMGMGMGKTLSAPTGEYIAPLAHAQRLDSEVHTTCWCSSGDAAIRRCGFGDRLCESRSCCCAQSMWRADG